MFSIRCCIPSYLRHSHCFDYLCGDFRGQIRLLSITRTVLDVAEFATLEKPKLSNKISLINQGLGDAKTIFCLLKTPSTSLNVKKYCLKTLTKCREVKQSWQAGTLNKRDLFGLLQVFLALFRRVLTLLNYVVFRPWKAAARYFCTGEKYARTVGISHRFSTIRNGLKTGSILCRLLYGTKKPFQRVANLCLSIAKTVLGTLRCCRVNVHPAVHLSVAILGSLYSIYEIYKKTL